MAGQVAAAEQASQRLDAELWRISSELKAEEDAKVNENKEVRKQVDAIAKPIEQNYQGLIRQLRDRNAVGPNRE